MNVIKFRTTQISGIPGKVTVALDEETGSVYLKQMIMLSKENPNWTDDLEHCKIIRESTRYIVIERAVHFHRNTFGSILGAISDLIEKNDLMNKFPDEIEYAKIPEK
jgi:hypothetical protein